MITLFKKIFIYEDDPFEHYRMTIVTDLVHVPLCVATKDNIIYIQQRNKLGSYLIPYTNLPENQNVIHPTPKLINMIKIAIKNFTSNTNAVHAYNLQKSTTILKINFTMTMAERNMVISEIRERYL